MSDEVQCPNSGQKSQRVIVTTPSRDQTVSGELDPQARAILEMLIESRIAPTHTLSVEQARAAFAERRALEVHADDPSVLVEHHSFAAVPSRVIRFITFTPTKCSPASTIVYCHGGGWVLGRADDFVSHCKALASSCASTVISVDYRLAPEHRFPCALEDVIMTARWIRDHGAGLGIDADRMGIAGDSAGGNLAAASCLSLRDSGDPCLSFQVLFYPALSDKLDSRSHQEFATGYMLSTQDMAWFWSKYLDPGTATTSAYAAPLEAEDLSDLPPAFIATAEFDPLRDEGEAYGHRLRAADVSCETVRAKGLIHGFLGMTRLIDEAQRMIDHVGIWLESLLKGDQAGERKEP